MRYIISEPWYYENQTSNLPIICLEVLLVMYGNA